MLDIFNNDAFKVTNLVAALDRVPYKPDFLAGLGIFTPMPIRTLSAAIEKRETALSLVQTSQRGAPLKQRDTEKRDIRDVRTTRIALGDTLHAWELQGVRRFGDERDVQPVAEEVMRKMVNVRADVELTLERHRLGAIDGLVLDADGSTLIDWYAFWGITRRATLRWTFSPTTGDGSIRKTCQGVIRRMKRAARGSWIEGQTRAVALCGDDFFDALIQSKEVRETYLNYQAAADLRGGVESQFQYGSITWINYRGTDDNLETSVAVGVKQARFFPINGRNLFGHFMSPGESLEFVNTLGRPFYPMLVPDRDRNTKVDIEIYTYPLFACMHPDMLERGDIA